MHASAALQKPFRLFDFRTMYQNIYLTFRLLTCIIDEAGGVVGATPEGMSSYFVKGENVA